VYVWCVYVGVGEHVCVRVCICVCEYMTVFIGWCMHVSHCVVA